MIVSTWNVLHKVHADNWGESPEAKLDEPERILAIARRVRELCAFSLAVCLQEVSGDQLRALTAAHVFHMPYPRVPKPKRGGPGLADPTEHLVVLTNRAGRTLAAHTFPSDNGKGYLSVQLDNGLIVVSTHVTWGHKSIAQLEEIAAYAREHSGSPMIIGGDFNAPKTPVSAALGEGFSIASLSQNGRHTRPHTAGEGKSQDIDHVIGHMARAVESAVEDGNGLSDHNPVWAKFA